MPHRIDLTGMRFGRLLVVSCAGRNPYGGFRYLCKCDCGKEKISPYTSLRDGNSQSCGCLRSDRMRVEIHRVRMKSPVWGVLPERACENRVFRSYAKHARKRNLGWELDFETFKGFLYSNCFYCNAPPRQRMRSRRTSILYTGVDRIDSSQGYTEDNVVPSCGTCNYMKSDMSTHDFLEHLGRIVKNVPPKQEMRTA